MLALLVFWPVDRVGAETYRPSVRLGKDGGVVALSGGALLGWNRRGSVQVMQDTGAWRPVFRLTPAGGRRASVRIVDAIGLNGRALLLAEYAGRSDQSAARSAVFEVGSAADVRQLAELPPSQMYIALTRWNGRAWIQDIDGEVRELLSDGQLGQRLAATSRAGARDVVPPMLVGGPADSPVFYVSPDRSKANDHPGSCYSDGRNRWRLVDGCPVAPTTCGDYLITTDSDRMRVVVRSVADARPLAKWQTDREPLVVCDESGGVLVGRQTVAKLSLPDLTRRWTFRLKSGRATAIAAVRGKVLIWTDEGAAIWVPASVTSPPR